VQPLLISPRVRTRVYVFIDKRDLDRAVLRLRMNAIIIGTRYYHLQHVSYSLCLSLSLFLANTRKYDFHVLFSFPKILNNEFGYLL